MCCYVFNVVEILGSEIFVVWQDTDLNVYLKYSPDAGTTWQSSGNAIGSGDKPRVAVDNSGYLYVVLG